MTFSNGYALIVSIASYQNIGSLPQTIINDGQDIYNLLIDQKKCGYHPQNVKLLLNSSASQKKIIKELRRLANVAKAEDTIVVYFSGHGGRIANGDQIQNCLLPYDANPQDLEKTCINGNKLTKIFRQITSNRLAVFLDSCYAGGTAEPKSNSIGFANFKKGFDENYYAILAEGKGRTIIASSRADEESLVFPTMNNSLFTHYLLRGLNGEAKHRGDGLIRILDLFDYISEMVPNHDQRQHPIFKGELENNFPISLYSGGVKSNLQTEKRDKTTDNRPTIKYQIGRDNIGSESEIGQINITNYRD